MAKKSGRGRGAPSILSLLLLVCSVLVGLIAMHALALHDLESVGSPTAMAMDSGALAMPGVAGSPTAVLPGPLDAVAVITPGYPTEQMGMFACVLALLMGVLALAANAARLPGQRPRGLATMSSGATTAGAIRPSRPPDLNDLSISRT